MKITTAIIAAIVLSICSYSAFAQQSQQTNPLLAYSNAPILFDQVNAKLIREAASSALAKSDERIKQISSVDPGNHTFSNTLKAFDELDYDIFDLLRKFILIAGTYETDSTRDAARKEQEKLQLYRNNLFLNEGLYSQSNLGIKVGLKFNFKRLSESMKVKSDFVETATKLFISSLIQSNI